MSLKKYVTLDSKLSIYDVLKNQAINSHLAYGHDGYAPKNKIDQKMREYLGRNSKSICANDIEKYRQLVQSLKNSRWSVLKGEDINNTLDLRNYFFLRHDVDGDILSAIDCAEMLNEESLTATFYILHTATYYGQFRGDGVFLRNESMKDVYLYIQELGHEVGLHTDSLGACLAHGVNPIECIENELEWFQKNGIRLSSTAPHNSYYVHNASNSAVFLGRSVFDPYMSDKPFKLMDEGEKDGVCFPLGGVDEAKWGLKFEANDVYKRLGSAFDDLIYLSITNYDRFAMTSFNQEGQSCCNFQDVSHEFVQNKFSDLSRDAFLYISTHPEYYGNKTFQQVGRNFGRYPFMQYDCISSFMNDYVRWVEHDRSILTRVRKLLSQKLGDDSLIKKGYRYINSLR